MTAENRFRDAHRSTLLERLDADGGRLAGRAAADLAPLALRLPGGEAWSYLPRDRGLEIVAGEHAPTIVQLDADAWLGLWNATESVFGLVLGGRAELVAGEAADFAAWEPALRVLYEELPPYDLQAPLLGRDGEEVDPTETFHPDDDPERMAAFLHVTGYILVHEVFPKREIEALAEGAAALRAAARDGDEMSWWCTHEDGRRICSRVLDGGTDPRFKALPSDPRVLRIVALSEFALEPTPTEGISILFKQSRMVFDGKADQPWHRDCGLGGHALMCPLMNGSLFLNAATRESGELRFLPGSWRTAGCLLDDPDYSAGVALEAGPGDFSLHYGDGFHAGTPPTSPHGPFRTSVVFEYGRPGRSQEQSQEHYDQLMHEADARNLHGGRAGERAPRSGESD